MANEEKTEKPGQAGSSDLRARQPGEIDDGRPPMGEVPADAPAVMNETSPAASATGREERSEPARDDAYEPAPLRADPVRPDPHAETADKAAERPAPAVSSPGRGGNKGGAGRGFVGGIVGSVLVLSLAGAGAYFTRDRWAPPVAATIASHAPQGGGQAEERVRISESINTLKTETADLRSQMSSVGNRLQSVQEDIDSLKQQSEKIAASAAAATDRPQPDVTQPLEDINQRLSQVEAGSGRLNALEQRLADVQSALSNVQTRVEKESGQSSAPAATVLAVNQLAEALGRSGAYAPELESVRAIAAGDSEMAPAIGTLEQWSRSGLPTLGEIRAGFPAMARSAAQAGSDSRGDGWLDGVVNQLSALVTVRKVGDAALSGGGVDAALAEADAALEKGDLAGAANAIEGLEGPAADAAAGWLAKARERLAADKALADLRSAAIARLNAARG